MSIYSKDKCTQKELLTFKRTVCNWLVKNGVNPKKIKMRCQRNYDGNIKIETYKTEMTNKKKSRRYLTEKKDGVSQDGWYSGHFETKISMGVYFYRNEWADYLKDKDQQEWNLADIKKYYEKTNNKRILGA